MPRAKSNTPVSLAEKTELLAATVHDPALFVSLAFPWEKPGTPLRDESGPDRWQIQILKTIAGDLQQKKDSCRVAVASGHGIGKTALISWIILWFMSTRPNPQIVVTAGTESQLKTKTWRELSKWHKLVINREWFNWTATKFYHVDNEETWFAAAIPWSANNPDAFQGTHEERGTLIIYDEGSAVEDPIWEATEGAMTTKGAIWVAFGNPVRNTGRFKECFNRYKHRWHCFQIDSRESKKASKTQINEWVEDDGEDSDWVRIRVRGVFPRSGLTEFISIEDVERAMQFKVDERNLRRMDLVMGVDVARFGDDQTVFTFRMGRKVLEQVKYRNKDTMQVADLVNILVDKMKPRGIFVDEGGLGAGVVDALRRGRHSSIVIAVNSSHKPVDTIAYANKRIEMWGRMKAWLGGDVELPYGNELLTDLIGPMYTYNKREQLLLEKKEDMKRRGMASPDLGDSLALTFADNSVYGTLYDEEDNFVADRFNQKRTGRSSVGGY